MTDEAEPVVGGIQKRFRDLSVDVREERIIRYIVKQVSLGRPMDDIMADSYIVEHTSDVTRATILQNPSVLHALEEEIKQQFADYRSATGSGGEEDVPE